MIFQNSMGPKNQGVMVPGGTTQGNFYLPCYWNFHLILCWNHRIYLYDNIHNISWELVNKFEINQMNKKYEKKTNKTL
jgi:hypothetical protein